MWTVLAVVTAVWGVSRFDSYADEEIASVLAASGFSEAEVTVDGRDLLVSGVDADDLDRVIAALEEIDGVRQVRGDVEVLAATVTTATPSTTAPPTTSTTTTTTTVATQPQASLVATLGPGSFRLSGVVPDEETATRIVTAANIAYAPFVESDLQVSGDVDSPDWLAASSDGAGAPANDYRRHDQG